ncbi:V-type H+-transporting ATPase subunit D [Pancytospora philotis]|nr:V-type H+-transporting ATPase subunit D [Pancytospora philotis]
MDSGRVQAFATRFNYRLIEGQLKNAVNGHSLLRAKSAALQAKYRKMEEHYNARMSDISGLFQRAFALLSRAEFFGADMGVFESQCARAPVLVGTTVEQVCGVSLPSFELVRAPGAAPSTQFRGASKLRECREAFDALLALLVDMASVKNSFAVLRQTLTMTNRRVNALEHIIIPRLQRTLVFISGELDEQERESFSRLKKIKDMPK